MDNLTDKSTDNSADKGVVASKVSANSINDAAGMESTVGQLESEARRRFSRNAIAGGAVLLSLGNRSAFGATLGCMSVATINSFDPGTNMFISAPAGRPTRNEDLAAEIHRISNSQSPFLGTDGHYSTCQDPGSLDGVCLITGHCP